jgi:hypothetical protein
MRASVVTIAACALLALSGCGNKDTDATGNAPGEADGPGMPNDPSARDAAPGQLSETSPPSAPASDPVQPVPNEASADSEDQPPRQ